LQACREDSVDSISIGLDIGSSAVRAAEISFDRHQRRLRRLAQVGLPSGAVVDGEVVNPIAVGEALRRLWAEAGFSSHKVVLGVSGHRLIVRQADVPALNNDDLRSALRFDSQELIPIPMDDASFDFQVLARGEETDDSGRATARILIVAAHREMLRSHLASLAHAGLEAVAIDASPLALMRVVPSGADSGVEALVSIGAELTTVAVRQGGVPRFIRSLAIGGANLTSGIAAAMHVEPAVAEAIKRGAVPTGSPQLAQARKAVATDLRDLGEDVRATIDFFVSQADGSRVERLLVTGGASMTEGLVEQLAGGMDVEIRRIDPFALLTLGDIGLDQSDLQRARGTAATAVGLALWSAEPPGQRMSVLPGEVAEARKVRRMAVMAGAGVAGLAGLLVFVGAAKGLAAHLERSHVHDAQRQVAVLQAQVAQLQAETAVHSKVSARANLVKTALQGDIDWYRVISEIQAAMPANVHFASISGSRTVSTSGSANSAAVGTLNFQLEATGGMPAAASWLDALQKDGSLQGSWVSGIAENGNDGALTFGSTAMLTSKSHSGRDSKVTP
jgi:type IV pilus assembly protein PilM